MELWTSHSNPRKQVALSVACTVVGAILLYGFRDFRATGSNAMAGFLLGVLLLVIGVAAFLARGQQTVIVDRGARRITIKDANRFNSKTRTIAFADIVAVGMGYLGDRSDGVMWYYLVLTLHNGEEYPLFAPGRFFPAAWTEPS